MRNFIYYNSELINSLLSQFNDGLVRNVVEKQSSEQGNDDTVINPSTDHGAKIELGILGIQASRTLPSSEHISRSNTTADTTTESIPLDSALDRLLKYMREYKYINNNDYQSYIEIVSSFDFVNLKQLSYFASSRYNVLRKGATNRPKGITSDESLKDKIEILTKLLPTSAFALNDQYIVPLNHMYLRSPIGAIQFTYSNKMNLVGYAASKLEDAYKFNHWNLYNDYYTQLKEMMKSIFPDQNLQVVEPICLFL